MNYFPALLGGSMIGLAAIIVMATNGRIMGVSGIIAHFLPPPAQDWSWRLLFLAGVFLAPLTYWLVIGEPPLIIINANTPLLLSAGFIVGFGTVLGSGCTSGHGVCGLARISPRSVVATVTFMLTAILTVYILRHVLRG